MNLKKKKILVTGSSGFIGSHIVKKLNTLGAQVEEFDKSARQDITNQKQVEEVIKKNFDIIYHLAGFSGSSQSNKDASKTFKINTFTTINLFDQVTKYSPKTKVIVSSSRLEYGRPEYLPVDENHPTQPLSAYGLSKLCATQMAMIYYKIYDLDVTVFRTSNVYGPHKVANFKGYNLINHFIDVALENGKVTIFGNGSQERDYIYVDDLIEAFLLAGIKKTSGEIYNLGYGESISLKDMAKLIIKTVGRGRLKLVSWPKDYREVETGSYVSDITLVKKELGFVPKINFGTGIKLTLKEF